MKQGNKLLVISVAAMGYELLTKNNMLQCGEVNFLPAAAPFPSLTCCSQATFRTATPPAKHGIIANGIFRRDLRKALFWEQSANLVRGGRIWDDFSRKGSRVGMICWQQSLGEHLDMVLSPAPIHKHIGGMISDCLTRPADLNETIRQTLGKFPLKHYWGPLASEKSGQWIAMATEKILQSPNAPELLMTYLPTLDYALQRHGPNHSRSERAVDMLFLHMNKLIKAARAAEYEVLIFGDYAIGEVSGEAIFPNRALKDAYLFSPRLVGKREYADLFHSRAFAMVDHEIAHVFVDDNGDIETTQRTLEMLDGVEAVYDKAQQAELGLDHANSGELVIVAEPGRWFAYPWWTEAKAAPDFAGHIDIHNKPGYDPCELFFQPLTINISQDTTLVRGSHGRGGAGREIAFGTTLDLGDTPPTTLLEIAQFTKRFLTEL
ncbi:MAG: alkaline phosphatase family protein [Phycisphaerales bacterium]|nr:alkaline phosphatase family protein [Phycisphaerales bacterium]MBT7171892.1 alkaline phosphatase family protein [Phycisphaerales bacterium]